MDFENHNCGHIFGTFKANVIKLHILLPIRLKESYKTSPEPLSRCFNFFRIL